MDAKSTFRSWAAGLGIGSLLLVAVLPLSGWLVREQLSWQLWPFDPRPKAVNAGFPMDRGGLNLDRSAMKKIIRRANEKPSDLKAQMSRVILEMPVNTDNPNRLSGLNDLILRFPKEPAAYATYIRYACSQIQVTQALDLAWKLSADQKQPKPLKLSPEALQAVASAQDAARRGEALNTGNAMFPMMLCYLHFVKAEPQKALDALMRSAACDTWDDYAWMEPRANWEAREQALRDREALRKIITGASVLFPNLSGLRNAARAAAGRAMEMEIAGDTASGLQIRMAVLHVGSLMRVQSTTLVGSLVGMAVVETAMQRPAGAPLVETGQSLVASRRLKTVADRFGNYLKSKGYDREAQQVAREAAAGEEAMDLVKLVSSTYIMTGPVLILIVLWILNCLLLGLALWLLIFWGLSEWAARSGNVSEERGLSKRVTAALAAGILGGVAVMAAASSMDTAARAGIVLGLVAAAAVLALVTRSSPFGALAASFGTTAGFLLLQISVASGAAGFAAIINYIRMADQSADPPIFPYMLVAGLLLAAPVVVVSVAAAIRRRPVSGALAAHIRKHWPIAACILLFSYSVSAIFTARQEMALNEGLQRMITHEGKLLAYLAGKQWPGAVE